MGENSQEEIVEKIEKKDSFKDILRFALIALVIFIPIRFFIAQPFIVSGSSMYPTFGDGDYLIVDELSYDFEKPHRGDVIVFRYPGDPSKFYIKRIVGLPGETVEIKNGNVFIKNASSKEGFKIDDTHALKTNLDALVNLTVTLSPTQYYVLGDNRSASSDSRVWGPLDKSFIKGRPLVRLLPVSKISLLPGVN